MEKKGKRQECKECIYRKDSTCLLKGRCPMKDLLLLKNVMETLEPKRYLSRWDCKTGKCLSEPNEEFIFQKGDYFIVEISDFPKVTEKANYRPYGKKFSELRFQKTEEIVSIGDIYLFNGEDWILQK